LPTRPFVKRILDAMFDTPRRSADGIIVLGECMRARLLDHGLPDTRIHVAENWADGASIRPLPFPDNPPLTVLYSGNLGLAHDIETIQATMACLRSDPGFHFVFSGGGPKRDTLQEFCRSNGLTNVAFCGYRDRDDLGNALSRCHVGLVTQRTATRGSIVPSKTYGLMAAGRPVLYIGPRDATPARIISRYGCGWQLDPGDIGGVVGLLKSLAAEPALAAEAGRRGRQAFSEHYDRPTGVGRICSILGVKLTDPL
jgi:colanic acid biosynthesis glycosyl transferase WcaI